MTEATTPKEKLVDKDWNWHPSLPLDRASPFSWPLSPKGIWRWFLRILVQADNFGALGRVSIIYLELDDA